MPTAYTAWLLLLATGAATTTVAAGGHGVAPADLAERLGDTGLFANDSDDIRPENIPFSPQYPLWSDAASKRRWLYLPPGTFIDASNPDAWEFPRGTRLWKEFGHERPVETRFIERLDDGSWRYATYVWEADGRDARLAPASGVRGLPRADAPGGRYDIPSRDDCRACHEGAVVPVLGVSTLQLSPDRDPLAPHAEPGHAGHADLRELAARGLLRNLPQVLLDSAPRIATGSAVARAALGYLHANCGHCHNGSGPMLLVDLDLSQGIGAGPDHVLGSLLGQPSEFRVPGAEMRLVPGRPEDSVLTVRMRSRNPVLQMPPLGTRLVDTAGVAAVERWIQQLSQPAEELHP